MRLTPLLGALVAAAVLVPAAVSQAATVSYESGALVYRGTGNEANKVLVSTYQPWGDPSTYLSISDATGIAQTSSTSLWEKETSGYGAMLCELDRNRPVKIYGEANKDDIGIYFNGVPESIPFEPHGGDGNDELEDASSTEAAITLYGDNGDDKLLGHNGNDYLDGGEGTDDVDGGAGNDQVHGGGGNDVIRGDQRARSAAPSR